MRAWLVLSLGLAVGCGGSEAGDVTDGGPDAASADTSGARDSTTVDAPPSDTSTLDSAPPDAPPGCTLFSDPCVAQFVAQTERAAACIGHPDTCASSGGTDASGCGLLTKDPDGTQICTWTDGAVVDNGKTTGKATNGKGDLCYSYNLVESGGSVTITISFPGVAGTWTERVTAGSDGTATESVGCPDGTTSPSFSQAAWDACDVGVTCCSASTPPSCGS